MTKICEQTNVAQTDESAVACDQPLSTDCVIFSDAISYLGLPADSTLTTVFAAMLASLIDARNRIEILEP